VVQIVKNLPAMRRPEFSPWRTKLKRIVRLCPAQLTTSFTGTNGKGAPSEALRFLPITVLKVCI